MVVHEFIVHERVKIVLYCNGSKHDDLHSFVTEADEIHQAQKQTFYLPGGAYTILKNYPTFEVNFSLQILIKDTDLFLSSSICHIAQIQSISFYF